MPKEKRDNFGGLPVGVFEDIHNGCVGAQLPVLANQQARVIEILGALAREEHAAANGGPGYTGIWDAISLIRSLEDKWEAVTKLPGNATPQQVKLATDAVVKQLSAIGTQWQTVGTTDALFFTTKL